MASAAGARGRGAVRDRRVPEIPRRPGRAASGEVPWRRCWRVCPTSTTSPRRSSRARGPGAGEEGLLHGDLDPGQRPGGRRSAGGGDRLRLPDDGRRPGVRRGGDGEHLRHVRAPAPADRGRLDTSDHGAGSATRPSALALYRAAYALTTSNCFSARAATGTSSGARACSSARTSAPPSDGAGNTGARPRTRPVPAGSPGW